MSSDPKRCRDAGPAPSPARPAATAWERAVRAWLKLRSEIRDLVFVGLGFALALTAAIATDAFDNLYAFVHRHEDWELNELLAALIIMPFCLAAYSVRRLGDLRREAGLRRRAEGEARQLAAHDALTGLPNRRKMTESLRAALARTRREGGTVAALLVDLDRFKPVNDLRGHAAGDRLLQMVADRLRATVRETDIIARMGGDEFVVVSYFGPGPALPQSLAGGTGMTEAEEPVNSASRLARRVVAALETGFDLGDGSSPVLVGASVGVALAQCGETQPEELLRQADLAMYRAKGEGRGCFRFFEAEMDTRMREKAELEAQLREAILADRLVPHFQPLVALNPGGELIGFEMLARWQHPERGMVPPAEFIPLAEDTGLIVPMTERLLRHACRAAMTWPEHLTLAVNVSPVQLRDRALPSSIAAALAESGMRASRLEIELTESALVDNYDLARELLGELKELGVRLALDDFGTGYSSLRHLQTLPFDKIKVDAGFVRSMGSSPGSSKIVAAVVGLGHSLGLPTVAEGIEDEATAAVLAQMGCDIGQGWLFGRPASETDAHQLAARFASATEAIPTTAR